MSNVTMKHVRPPNQAGWERDVARCGARILSDLGYHFLLTLPHNHPNNKYAAIKGKAPGVIGAVGTWVPRKNWQDASAKPSVAEAFADIGIKTKYVPNLGILLGGSVEVNGEHAGYLTAIDVDTDDESAIGMFSELFNYANPIRRGRRGGTFLCITDESESKDFTRKRGSEGFIEGGDENKVQLLRSGKQTVVLGVHPATLNRFRWETVPMDGPSEATTAIPSITELPIVSTAKLAEILAALGFERGGSAKQASADEIKALSKRQQEITADLRNTAPLDFHDVDERLGITTLIESEPYLRGRLLVEHEDIADHSANDLIIAKELRRHLGDKFDAHVARAVLSHFPACSAEEKQDERFVARIMAVAETEATHSTGEAFGIVDDEIGDAVPDTVREAWDIQALERTQRADRMRLQEQREAAQRELEAARAEEQNEEQGEPIRATISKGGSTILRSTDIHDNFVPADDVIEGLLPAVGLAVVYADANVGKTFLAIEMLDRVMRGEKFLGLNTERGDVLLVAGEGSEGLKKRMAALHRVRPYEGAGIAVSFDLPSFQLSPELGAKKLKRQIKECKDQSGKEVRLVVLDNLIAMVGGGDLHASSDTKPMLDALGNLAKEQGLCILIIHHENKSGGTAGSFAIRASVDVMLQIQEDKNGIRTVRIDKSRDGGKSLSLRFRLRFVPLGFNKWGNEIGSCVVEDYAGPDMAAVDDDDVPVLKRRDDREDRVAMLLEVARDEASKSAAADEALYEVSLDVPSLIKAVNVWRGQFCGLDGKPLAPLDPKGVRRVVQSAVESGRLIARGRRYFLPE